jgi:hypothetical protein
MNMKKNESKIGDLIRQFSQDKRIKSGLLRKRVESGWTELMGPYISNETESIRLDQGVLQLRITSASLRQELHFSRDQIRSKLNDYLGEEYIREVIVK